MRLYITKTGPASFRVRSSQSPVSAYILNPHLTNVRTLADNLGNVVTEWEPLGRLLAFFAASDWEQEEAARSLDIHYEE